MLNKQRTAIPEQGGNDEDASRNKKDTAGGWMPRARGAKRNSVWTTLTTHGVTTRSKEMAGRWLSGGRRGTKWKVLNDIANGTACTWLADPSATSPESTSYSVRPHPCPNDSAWLAEPRAISPQPYPSCFPWRRPGRFVLEALFSSCSALSAPCQRRRWLVGQPNAPWIRPVPSAPPSSVNDGAGYLFPNRGEPLTPAHNADPATDGLRAHPQPASSRWASSTMASWARKWSVY